MIGLKPKAFFFNSKPVMRAVDRATRKVLSRFGAFVRRTAKSSIRKARMKRISELSPEELKSFRMRQAIAKREGKPKPRRPLKSSDPGKPPRNRSGLLKRLLWFGYDIYRRSVVVGPTTAGPKAAGSIEHGGPVRITAGPNKGSIRQMAARPFMRPAMNENLPQLPAMWRDTVKK